ncbi:MAG: thioredoxin domain-containing protein [Alphaproteobacteria bacterium]|nr:thioredoxin domain-containing protein [Alphaproteobacteria bacterium]
MSENRLGRETSPYLLQHKENPVHWWPWGEEALAAAERANKPILLSIGYAACHWCHVMAHESFEDPATAAVMNELYVNIKVDREERPDIDSIYMTSLHLLGEQGGWPLTMFLTPRGEPFWGGTYFPPTARYGRPGFSDVLKGVADVYRRDPGKVTRNVTALLAGLQRTGASQPGNAPTLAQINAVAERLAQEVDPVLGGFGSAPKFPQPSIFLLLWRAWLRTRIPAFKHAVTVTLNQMCQGGIYDHLGGGFARYSTDAEWLVPHFEKMLYDNAQLIDLLTLVWQETREPLYEQRIRETVAWLQREMLARDNSNGFAFASTLDADSEGEEGKFYVWIEAEIDRLLGADAAAFKNAYDVTPAGNWEGHTILNRSRRLSLGAAIDEAQLARCRAILWRERENRVRPGWDDKVLVDWNGMMIAALARAGMVFDMPSWIDMAITAFDFVCQHMIENGRLRHSWRHGVVKHAACLDDYGHMAAAALALDSATGNSTYRERATAWLDILDRHYWDRDAGGYFFTADDAPGLIVRTKTAHDNAVPAGNGILVDVLARLYFLTGETRFRDRADALIGAFSGELGRNIFGLSSLLNGCETIENNVQIVIVGEPGSPDVKGLVRAALGVSLPSAILSVVRPQAALFVGHPAHGKTKLGHQSAAYVCRGPVCSLPITDPAALTTALRLG